MRFSRHLDRNTRWLYAVLVTNFALYGITFTIIGASIPQIIRAFHWSYGMTGLVLASGSIGYFIFTFLTGMLLHRFGPRAGMIVGLLLEGGSLLFIARSPLPALNMALFFVLGAGQGITEVVTNYEVVKMEKEGESGLMTLLHAFFCLGATIGPFGVGSLARLSLGWNAVYTAGGVFAFGMIVPFSVLSLYGADRADAATIGGREASFHGDRPLDRGEIAVETTRRARSIRVLFEPMLLLSFSIILLYVGSELGIANWISEYFVKEMGTTPANAAYVVSVLWAGILIGRLFLSSLALGTRREVLLFSCASVCTLFFFFTLLSRSVFTTLAFVFFTGFGYSGIYPLVMSIVGNRYRAGVAVGFITTGGGIGSLVFPFILALLADRVGLKGGFFFCLFLNGVLLFFTVLMLRLVKRGARDTRPSGEIPS